MTARSAFALLRDAVAVAAIAGVTALALRRWVGDRYPVPTGSMQPLLHGDPLDGDVVFVNKLASAAAVRRHDVVVVTAPEAARSSGTNGASSDLPLLVKRVVAVGDDRDACWVDLRDGDLWLGPDPQRLERETKDPIAARDLRAIWFEWPRRGAEPVAQCLDLGRAEVDAAAIVAPPLEGGLDGARRLLSAELRRERLLRPQSAFVPEGFVGVVRPVDTTYLDARGERGRESGALPVEDFGFDLVLGGAPDVLLCCFDLRPDAWTFAFEPASGGAVLWRNGEVVATHELYAAATPRPLPGTGMRVEYGVLDGRFFLVVDGRADASWLVERKPEWVVPDLGPAARQLPKNLLYVAAAGRSPLRLLRLVVFRDVHHRRDRVAAMPGDAAWPVWVEPGKWFLLGDNAFDSQDSRSFGPVPASSFVGRPVAVLGPWPRTRWLSRSPR